MPRPLPDGQTMSAFPVSENVICLDCGLPVTVYVDMAAWCDGCSSFVDVERTNELTAISE